MQHLDKISTFNLFKFSIFLLQTILSKNINLNTDLYYPFFQSCMGSTDHEIDYFIPKEIENIIIKKPFGYSPNGERIYNLYKLKCVRKYYNPIHVCFYQNSVYVIRWTCYPGEDLQHLIFNSLKKQFGKKIMKQIKKTYSSFPILDQLNNIHEIIDCLGFNEKELRNQITKQLNYFL